MDYLWGAMGIKPRPPGKKTPREMVEDLQRKARDLEARIQAQDRAFHAERVQAARHHKAGETVAARQALARSLATRRNIQVMQNSANTCWGLAVHIDSLGLLQETFDVMQKSSVMIEQMIKQSNLDPEKVTTLTERLQESTQVVAEIQDVLSRPLDVSSVAAGELDFDALDAELAALNLDDELAAAASSVETLPTPAVPSKPTPKAAVKPAKTAARVAVRGSVAPPFPQSAAERSAHAQLVRSPAVPTTTPSAAAAAAVELTPISTSPETPSGRMMVMLAD